jgi:hypothetical protein
MRKYFIHTCHYLSGMAVQDGQMTFTGHASDFDFLFGTWRVEHDRLKSRLTQSTEWEQFDGTCSASPILGGSGNVDDNLLHLPSGDYRAATIRTFDEDTRRWSIWWIDGRNPHSIDVPVVGGFHAGVGQFFANDTLNGQPIDVRFRWTETATASPRWDQAFSADDGVNWEVNWRMKFIRSDG